MMSVYKYVLILFVSLFHLTAVAQQNAAENFIKNLSKENKKIAHLYFIETEIKNQDSLNYFLAKYHLQYNNDSIFWNYFNKSKKLFLNDTIAVGFASCYFLQNNATNINRDEWFKNISSLPKTKSLKNLSDIYYLKNSNPRKIKLDDYPTVLRESVKEYKFAAKKNPTKAALLSAIIPGLGKMYIGKFRIGSSAMLLNGIFAYQTYESIHHLGIKHPLSIVNMLLATIFYTSNIYGSYRDTQYYKKEKLQQLYNDASNYYSVESFPILYK